VKLPQKTYLRYKNRKLLVLDLGLLAAAICVALIPSILHASELPDKAKVQVLEAIRQRDAVQLKQADLQARYLSLEKAFNDELAQANAHVEQAKQQAAKDAHCSSVTDDLKCIEAPAPPAAVKNTTGK
jgi:hypothetical protein